MIVEDDSVIADAIELILSHAGYYLLHVQTIEAALNGLNYVQIDAVLLIPNGDGTRLSRLISKNHVPSKINFVFHNSY